MHFSFSEARELDKLSGRAKARVEREGKGLRERAKLKVKVGSF